MSNGEDFDETTSVESNETVIYVGAFFEVWGHVLTDCIKHLWFLKTKEFQEKFSNCRLVCVPRRSFKLIGNIKSFFEVLGFSFEDFVPITQLTRFKKIIIPDSSFFSDEEGKRYWTKEYKQMIDGVKSWGMEHITPTGIDKIYFSYNAKNKIVGEEKLEKFFASQGYKVIHPENYSFKEQLNMLLNCKALASPEGSCSHNAVFMKEDSKLLLIPRAYYITNYQLAIN